MTDLKLELDVQIKCPYCNSSSIDCTHANELDYDESGIWTFGESDCISKIGTTRLKEDNLIDESGSFTGHDTLFLGYCDNCGKAFKLGTYSLDSVCSRLPHKRNSPERKDIFSEIPHNVVFNDLGIPQSLVILGRRIQFTKVLHEPNVNIVETEDSNLTLPSSPLGSPLNIKVLPIPEESLDPLFENPPFGCFTIDSLHGRFSLRVWPFRDFDINLSLHELRPQEVGPLMIGTRISTSDGYFMKFIESIAVLPSELQKRPTHLIHTQPLDVKHLLSAAYLNIYKTEFAIRKKIWSVLENKYAVDSRNWWKGILNPEIRDAIVERAKKSLDANFRKCSPDAYLTLGECKEILSKKWGTDFSNVLQRKDFILSSLTVLEDIRNDVMHFRGFSFEKYEDLRAHCRALLQLFT